MTVQLFCGDCLEIMPEMAEHSIDAILTDIPYGTTACAWDTVIPFPDLWRVVKHVLKSRGVFVTTASQPFTSALVMSNVEWFKYIWDWDKVIPSGFMVAKYHPMKQTEDVCVFSRNGHTYNPQTTKHLRPIKTGMGKSLETAGFDKDPFYKKVYYDKQPTTLIAFEKVRDESVHPTQKPVALYEYLTLTYTNPGDTVLDMCAGSGTTGVACIKTGRNFIGIEKRQDYFEIMSRRIREAEAQMVMQI